MLHRLSEFLQARDINAITDNVIASLLWAIAVATIVCLTRQAVRWIKQLQMVAAAGDQGPTPDSYAISLPATQWNSLVSMAGAGSLLLMLLMAAMVHDTWGEWDQFFAWPLYLLMASGRVGISMLQYNIRLKDPSLKPQLTRSYKACKVLMTVGYLTLSVYVALSNRLLPF